ncbi:MAG: 50S ribosomal protein L21 [Candidatus Marinimicrobia bacterium]|nr:50S ribosomal protein L21 [Candidatus Neomarinimicrobiota bacterium]
MYAIVNIAGKQYKVAEGDKLQVARLSSEVGDKVNFDNVLLTDDGKDIIIGKPAVKGAVVSAEILEHGRLKKILVYKKKRRKGYQRKNGHRQDFSSIQVNSIKISTPIKKEPVKKTATAKTTKKETK